LDMVKEEFPKVIRIASKDNEGFSKANNRGIAKATGRFLLFLNSDTIVNKDALEEVVAFLDTHKDVGAATCKVVMPNGKLDDAAHRGFPTPWNALSHFSGLSKVFPHSKLFAGYSLGWMDTTVTHEIDACAGAFMMVRSQAGEEVGWWDEDYFFYGEDIDFCYRLKEKGWKIYFIATVSILHYKGVSGGIKKVSEQITTADEKTKLRVTKARFDAMSIFYKKHYKGKYPKSIHWIVLKGIALKKVMTLKSL
jgi:GT2 family glycosyltransferase